MRRDLPMLGNRFRLRKYRHTWPPPFQGHANMVESVAFEPDGTTLAFTSVINERTIGPVTSSSMYDQAHGT